MKTGTIALYIIILGFSGHYGFGQVVPPDFLCIKGDTLIWELPPNPCGNFIAVDIYFSDNSNGPYSLIGTITDESELSFIHTLAGVPDRFYYLISRYNCLNPLSPPSDTLDNKIPIPPRVNYVSAIGGGVELSWNPSPSPQTRFYIIYRVTPQGTVPIDTVTNTFIYLDSNADPDNRVEFYYVLAMDDCETKSPFEVAHNTMLPELTYDECTREATITWNPYNFWSAGIESYEIFVGNSVGMGQLAGSVQADQTTFVYEGLVNGTTYCFTIEAVETGGINRATSVTICRQVFVFDPVDLLCITDITTGPGGAVDLEWQVNPNADIEYMRVLRGNTDQAIEDVIFETQSINGMVQTFADLFANANARESYYVIETKDLCGNVVRSQFARNILLNAELLPGRRNNLFFNEFSMENASVTQYRIFRIADNSRILITQIPSGGGTALDYIDEIDGPAVGNTRFCYQIEAVFNHLCLNSEPGSTFSNIICVEQNSTIFAPNAFAPGGNNPEFKVVILYPESIVSYSMSVYDRYGGLLFETEDPDQGWNGRRGGRDLPMGTYAFIIRATQSNGRQLEEKGTITLIR